MPVVFIEAPPGIRTDAKKRMVQKINTAIEEVYPIGETLISCGNTRSIMLP